MAIHQLHESYKNGFITLKIFVVFKLTTMLHHSILLKKASIQKMDMIIK